MSHLEFELGGLFGGRLVLGRRQPLYYTMMPYITGIYGTPCFILLLCQLLLFSSLILLIFVGYFGCYKQYGWSRSWGRAMVQHMEGKSQDA